ncbi:MAG: hypothetical protein WDA16_12650 [Candidatus Thermoplasmatota archaeon]
MRAELFDCTGGCGTIHAILVDDRAGNPACAACGSPVRPLAVTDATRRAREAIAAALSAGAGAEDLDGSVRVVIEAGGLMRFVEHAATWDGPSKLVPVEPWER